MIHCPKSKLSPRLATRHAVACCRAPFAAFLAVVLTVIIFSTSAPAVEVTVQVTAFQVPERTLGLDTWNRSIHDDADLYQRLVGLAGQGKAELVFDHRVTTQSGARVMSHARSEFIYPTEFDPRHGNLLHTPTAFETRNLGTRIEGEATVVAGSTSPAAQAIDCFLFAERVRFEGLMPLEFPNLGASGPRTGTLGTPVFMTEAISGAVSLLNGQPMIIGLTRPADQADNQPGGASQAIIMTFARAATAKTDAAVASGATDRDWSPIRMHALTVRVPLLAAAQRVWNHGPESGEALRQAFLDLAQAGDGRIVAHAGVTSLSGQRAKAQSVTELIYHTELEDEDPLLVPTAFETRNLGVDWEIEVTRQAVTDELSGTATLSATRAPFWRAIPIGPGVAPPELEVPDFLSSQWTMPLSMTLGETSLVAAVTPPAEEGAGDTGSTRWLDVSFLKSIASGKTVPSAHPSATGASRRTAACLVVFSVTEAAAITLKERMDAPQADSEEVAASVDALWAAASSGEARLLALARCLQQWAGRSKVEGVREWMYPTEWVPARGRTDALYPSAWETTADGTRLEVEVHPGEGDDTGQITLSFSHEIAPPAFPSFETARQAAQPSAREDAAPPPRPTVYRLSVDRKTRYTAGTPQFLSIEKSPAPPGHQEHGRWLVSALNLHAQ